MTETAEELVAEHTRRELEGMAEKLGIGTTGIDKFHLAEAIIEARERASAKEMPKSKLKTPEVEVSGMKGPVKVNLRIGKKGVFAKCAAIDAQIKENEEAAVVIGTGVREIQSGIKDMRSAMDHKTMEMQKSVDEMQKSINAQMKANEKAAAKMGMGVKEMHNGITKFQSAIYNKTIELHSGIEVMEAELRKFQNETANYIKDFYYG